MIDLNKNNDDYKLIYINKVGFNYKGLGEYEFIFADDSIDLADVWGDGWEIDPAEGNAQPPDMECISRVGVIKAKDYNLKVGHESEFFSLSDCKDGILALGYEEIDENFDGMNRLVFSFGETLTSIEDKLKLRKLKLTYED